MTTSTDSVLTAVSTDENNLVLVEVETALGAVYSFPDMSMKSLEAVVPPSGRVPESITFLMFYNYSGAMLSVPIRLVKEVRVGEKILWKCPV